MLNLILSFKKEGDKPMLNHRYLKFDNFLLLINSTSCCSEDFFFCDRKQGQKKAQQNNNAMGVAAITCFGFADGSSW